MSVKVVVMCHNTPVTADELYRRLSECFDVTMFDSGSDPDKRPTCPAETFPNLYWTGCWAEALKRYGDADWLWVLGGDLTLLDEPRKYLDRLIFASGLDVACWSPAVEGKCRDLMRADKAEGRVFSVWHLEGQALALSKKMMTEIGRALPKESPIGWGVDMWMCWRGWKAGMKNILDGKVKLHHPLETGYDHKEALKQMRYLLEVYGRDVWGPEFRCHPWFEVFENNLKEVWVE